jgi:methylenetetrahydrofolate dehydrogenase (NADP+)/methenyltetrahydrofolate cyclohydrolase
MVLIRIRPTGPALTDEETMHTHTTGGRGRRLSGKEAAADIRRRVAKTAAALTEAGTIPRLAVVVATADESAAWYVRSIAKAATAVGITCDVVDLDVAASAGTVRATLDGLSADPSVHGIILQTPLPPGVDVTEMATAIAPAKDVDGANPESLGRLAAGLPAFPPATAAAVLALLDHHDVALNGRHAVVLGRSTVVGKPVAHLLLDRNATVTVCHSRTRNLAEHCLWADVLVAAVGRPGLVTGRHVTPASVVIDVGTNPTDDGGLVGDVAPEVAGLVEGLTPVPGGVGPVTTALLLEHTVRAAETAVDR